MPPLQAKATIHFTAIARYIEKIADSLAAHNMTVRAEAGGYAVESSFGTGHVRPAEGALHLRVEASDPATFNRLKHDLTGLVDFVARAEALKIEWTGDAVGAALPPDLRVLTVRRVRELTPRMRRITFAGSDLARYAAPDQIHCRLLFQKKGALAPEWPRLDDHGRILWPKSGKLASRIYTIRRIDAAAGTLDIDFVLHDGTGPGISWAAAAAPGDVVGLLGPAAHGLRPAGRYLLAGDETGLPGIARILEALPATAEGLALIEVADAAERQPIAAPPGVELRWLHRDGAAPGTLRLLPEAAHAMKRTAGPDDAFCWVGAEYSAFRELRRYLREELGLPSSSIVAFSHWRRGMSEEDVVEAGASAVSA
jgi:NADPH-dependent ferric siderophore reductase